MKKAILITALLITTAAFFLRIHRLSEIPPSLSWDEVSIGYNAYSILKTGKDEHGKFLPFDVFAAYGDYKPPAAIYLTVPSVAIFGLNEFSVRFPAALFGTLTVLLTYFLVKELFLKTKLADNMREVLALLSSVLLAFSPWHLNLSRAGFEATIALFFIVLGIYLCLKAVDKPKFWILAWLPFVISIYTFNSSRYFAPIISFGIFFLLRRSVKKNGKLFILGLVVAGVLMIPILPHLISKEARLRYVEVNIFSDPEVVKIANERIEESGNALWAKILHNRRVGYARRYVLHFLDHTQPEYLFVRGDGNPKFSIQDVGQFYIIEAPFLAIGMIGLVTQYPSLGFFLVFWIIAAIIPASVARETPHALRTLNSLPTWHIFIAYGILLTVSYLRKTKTISKVRLDVIFIYLLLFSYIFCGVYYLHEYYTHYPTEYSGEWQYGYKDAILFTHPKESQYDKIFVTDAIGRPYMYTLFYTKTDPDEFNRTKDASFDAAGFYHVYGFGTYRFGDVSGECPGKCLYVVPAEGERGSSNLLTRIRLLNGNPVLDIYEK